MAQKIRIRKGLETPLLIYGLKKTYFYRFLLLIVLAVVVFLRSLMSLIHGKGGILNFFLVTCFLLVALISSYLFFLARSRRKQYNFPKTESIISNRDLNHYLHR